MSELLSTSSWLLQDKRRRAAALFFVGMALLSFGPLLGLGRQSLFIVHDMLDGGIANRVVIAQSDRYFSIDAPIEQVGNGIPRWCFPSPLNIVNLLYLFFEPFTAFFTNYIAVHVLAFASMYYCLHVSYPSDRGWLKCGISAAFSLLPFYTTDGMSVAGLPAVSAAFIQFLKKQGRWFDGAVVLLFPFYSNLAIVGIYALILGGAGMAATALYSGRLPIQAACLLTGFGFLYGVAEYPLLFGMIFGAEPSHRQEFYPSMVSRDLEMSLQATFRLFLAGHEHAPSLHIGPLLLVLVTAIAALICKDPGTCLKLFSIVAMQFVLSGIAAFQHHELINQIRDSVSFLRQISFHRFINWAPFLWYLGAFEAIRFWSARAPPVVGAKPAVVLAAVFSTFLIFSVAVQNSEIRNNWLKVLTGADLKYAHGVAAFEPWFSPELYQRIKETINKPPSTYRVVSVGLPPDLALYNGFYCLDFYLSNYPLRYKKEFRKITSPELAKSPYWKGYFDGWGSRCYLFSSELWSHMMTKDDSASIQILDIDSDQFLKMGGQFILSAGPIRSMRSGNLKLLGTFESASSLWRVFVYEVISAIPNSGEAV